MPKVPRSSCPVAATLDLLGDRWSLILVRDMLVGKTRFGEFLVSPEGITTNILADRLKRLESWGVVERSTYAERPPRYDYRLTAKGRALLPVLQEMARWANRHVPGTARAPDAFMERKVEP